MPTTNRRENKLIELFLSAYENDTWKGCHVDWLDQQRKSAAVEALATRTSDGKTLAIEHTLIRPYGEFKTEFARPKKNRLPIY